MPAGNCVQQAAPVRADANGVNAAVAIRRRSVTGRLLRSRPRRRGGDWHSPYLGSGSLFSLPCFGYSNLSACFASHPGSYRTFTLSVQIMHSHVKNSVCKGIWHGRRHCLTFCVVVFSNSSLLHFVPMTTCSVSSHSCRCSK